MAVTQDYIVHPDNRRLWRKLTQPAAGGKVTDPGLVGDRPCVLMSDQDAAGYATVAFGATVRVSVKGEDNAGNSAVAIGDKLYYDAAATPTKINKDATNGVRYGTAVEAVSSGATSTVPVDLVG